MQDIKKTKYDIVMKVKLKLKFRQTQEKNISSTIIRISLQVWLLLSIVDTIASVITCYPSLPERLLDSMPVPDHRKLLNRFII